MEVFHGCSPVSYTHLDVYKRQVDGAVTQVLECGVEEKIFVDGAVRACVAVSYTHLDVYKRQLSDSAGNFTRTQAAGAGVDITLSLIHL